MASESIAEAIDVSSESESDEESSSHQEHPKCPICLAEDYDNDKALIKGCYHAFCLFCILQWAEMTRACPICKTKINHIVSNIDSEARTFTIIDMEKPALARPQTGYKSKSMQNISHQKIHSMVRRRVYEQALKPVTEFSSPIPFGPSAAQFKSPSSLENERRNWRRKLDVWIQAEAPVVFNHHLVESTLHADEESVRDQEIQMLYSMVKSLLEAYGDLRGCKDAGDQLASLLGNDTEIFIRDLMLFLISPYRLPQEFDQAVRYTVNGQDISPDDAISVDSEESSDIESDIVMPRSKRRKVEQEPAEIDLTSHETTAPSGSTT